MSWRSRNIQSEIESLEGIRPHQPFRTGRGKLRTVTEKQRVAHSSLSLLSRIKSQDRETQEGALPAQLIPFDEPLQLPLVEEHTGVKKRLSLSPRMRRASAMRASQQPLAASAPASASAITASGFSFSAPFPSAASAGAVGVGGAGRSSPSASASSSNNNNNNSFSNNNNYSSSTNTGATASSSSFGRQASALPMPSWVESVDSEPQPWADTSRFEHLTRVLAVVLLQTAQSMKSTRFELRRISLMVCLFFSICALTYAHSVCLSVCLSGLSIRLSPSTYFDSIRSCRWCPRFCAGSNLAFSVNFGNRASRRRGRGARMPRCLLSGFELVAFF